MRAVLVVNPQATSTTASGRDVLAAALASVLKLEVVETKHFGHASEAARDAVRDGADLVIAHGGDGTVNEVVNGMFEVAGPGDPAMPTLGVVPGGSANVFARALGLPKDPVDATHHLMGALATRSTREVGLGKADERWFTFNAGIGWDAEVVAEMERQRSRGREATPALYARIALSCYFRMARGEPKLSLQIGDDHPSELLHSVFVSNTDPWTYLGSTPVRMSPETSFDTGLGVLALTKMSTYPVLRHVAEMLRGRGKPHGSNSIQAADVPHLRVACTEPLRLQVDGDCLGERSVVEFSSVPNALRVAV
ncbi:diacylglycerol/lipid kinase family protein [Saccharopolyspora dendranthemae]|uniref:Diacylglycerol kinase family enzyme n=1 Tax=Saccharopolyspora dendranthemae TaxID=1181886 RepID=A0A561U065_9PSEU|nr:diacylglycerol kinase family protein [Saccharopolyspora dendranthemae]TWF92766.1 diacylglycerol kinase family enzyme [Saccharopolyspora dendranthemae]